MVRARVKRRGAQGQSNRAQSGRDTVRVNRIYAICESGQRLAYHARHTQHAATTAVIHGGEGDKYCTTVTIARGTFRLSHESVR